MRKPLALVCLLMFLPVAPVAAQEGAPLLAEDSAGDVRVIMADQSQPPPAGRYTQADMLGVSAVETADDFRFTVTVTDIEPDQEIPLADGMQYFVQFQHNDRQFRLHTYASVFIGSFHRTVLEARDGNRGAFYLVNANDIVTEVDAASNAYTVTVPRELLLDQSGSMPHPGVPITGFNAWSWGQLLGDGNFNLGPVGRSKVPGPIVTDRMPNEGNGTGIINVQYGVAQTGTARLFSKVPTRSSNGENTTFVYQVEAHNLATSADRFDLVVVDVPAGWTVRLPAANVNLEANETFTFPVLLSTPFQHVHGAYKGFIVEMRSQTDASSIGRVGLGVRYPAIPQPAGHHDKLFLRSISFTDNEVERMGFCPLFGGGSGCNGLYMNAAEQDETDTGEEVGGFNCGVGANPAPVQCFSWCVPLIPGLDLGLDFITTATGVLEASIKSTVPMQAATFSGELRYTPDASQIQDRCRFSFNGQDETLLATIAAEGTKDLPGTGATTPFTATITPTEASDFLGYQKGAGIYLLMQIEGTAPPQFFGPIPAPVVVPGGYLQLPLLEYHDEVNLTFSTTTGIELNVNGAQDRLVNPGKGVLFNMTLVNHDPPSKFRVEISGNHADWATVLVAGQIQVATGGEFTIPLGIKVPSDAVAGQAADLVVTVSSMSNLNERALVRVYATVDTTRTHPDDSAAIDALSGNLGKKATPGMEGLALLAALGVAMLIGRRD